MQPQHADAQLDAAIDFTQPLAANRHNPTAIFMTGASGFMGAYLLTELLQQTQAQVYCLMRKGDTDSTGMQRLQAHLAFYDLWQAAFAARITPVYGNLIEPQLGLADQQWQELGEKIDVIYHNGARVNAVYPYAKLKPANVDGTVEILRLASLRQTKPVHFVSSLAIFFNEPYVNKAVFERDFPVWDESFKGGYKQSKWVAESLVKQAHSRGLPGGIYRPGIISEHSQTAILGKTNNVTSAINVCLQMGQFPSLETVTRFAPVDYVSQAIVYLSQQASSDHQAFHLCNPQVIQWQDLFALLQANGHALRAAPYEQWLQALEQQIKQQPKNGEFSFLRYVLKRPVQLFSAGPQFDVQHTLAHLQPSTVRCPVIDQDLLAKYF